MQIIDTHHVKEIFGLHRQDSIEGRWIPLEAMYPFLEKMKNLISLKEIGASERGKPIYNIKTGSGPTKVLIWTQMHGNESTGTKAICDLLSFLTDNKDDIANEILLNCTISIIPILNPDGAETYTRVNANGIDLNRDAVDLVARESKVLRNELDTFQPDFCFNLHDQRTIFGVEGTENPATLSFLAPSEEVSRKVTKGRIKTMNVIVAMNRLMQQIIPNQIGRYTDEFYPTATGDNFQKLGYPTILIESGHFPADYEREKSRGYTFMALLQGIYHVATSKEFTEYQEYFDIPNNVKSFYDLLITFEGKKRDEIYQFKEVLENKKVSFVPELVQEKEETAQYFHQKN